MKRYLYITRVNLLETINYKEHLTITFVSNIVYIILIYFLWKEIYVNAGGLINGLTFKDTFLYLSMASCINTLYLTWADAHIAESILNGNIILRLLRPMDYIMNIFFEKLGTVGSNGIVIFIPTLIILAVVLRKNLFAGPMTVFFAVSLFLGFVLNFLFEFLIGIAAFKLESIWGLTALKNSVLMLFAGGVVPIDFFSGKLRTIVTYLPFRCVFDIPIQFAVNRNLDLYTGLNLLGMQIIWTLIFAVICEILFKISVRKITVNGG